MMIYLKTNKKTTRVTFPCATEFQLAKSNLVSAGNATRVAMILQRSHYFQIKQPNQKPTVSAINHENQYHTVKQKHHVHQQFRAQEKMRLVYVLVLQDCSVMHPLLLEMQVMIPTQAGNNLQNLSQL
jgi:hypothetical protein